MEEGRIPKLMTEWGPEWRDRGKAKKKLIVYIQTSMALNYKILMTDISGEIWSNKN